MFEKLAEVKERYLHLESEVSRAEVIANTNVWREKVKEHSNLRPVVEAYDAWLKVCADLEASQKLFEKERDEEMSDMLREEIDGLKERRDTLVGEIKTLLLPRDPNDEKNVIIEVRAGAGGEESALFAYAIQRMYYMFAENNRYKIEELDINATELGGIKEASFMIIGSGAYSKFKYEAGVHRVQRVPETEAQGRIHTSTVTVAILPEAEDVEIQIDEKDLKVDTYRSGGAGGQHVNKTESAIRITHMPTGIIVACQEERSQIKNRDKAMKMLKSKLYDMFQTQADEEYAAQRKNQVGTGDRSERIRTYNYPQGRVTDHRIGFTAYNLPEFLNGDIGDMIEALRIADQTAKLENAAGT